MPETLFTLSSLSGHSSSVDYFYAWISDQKILARNPSGEPVVIGVVSSKYQEVESTARSFQDRLIELGEIHVPLTPEQINEQLMSELKAEKELRNRMAVLVDEMSARLRQVEKREGKYESEESFIGSDVGGASNPASNYIVPGSGLGEDQAIVSGDIQGCR